MRFRPSSTYSVRSKAPLFWSKIEKPAGIANPKDFRFEVVKFALRARAKNAGKNPTWAKIQKNLEKTSGPAIYMSDGEGSYGKDKHYFADNIHLVVLNQANAQTAPDANGVMRPFVFDGSVSMIAPTPGNTAGGASGVNDRGDVAGYYYGGANPGLFEKPLLTAGGQAVQLGYPFGGGGSANAINGSGLAVGQAIRADGVTQTLPDPRIL